MTGRRIYGLVEAATVSTTGSMVGRRLAEGKLQAVGAFDYRAFPNGALQRSICPAAHAPQQAHRVCNRAERIQMPNTRHFNYKGCAIITRWSESDQVDSVRPTNFSASFSVESKLVGVDSWQEFPSGTFVDKATATANALMAAMRSIDHSLAAV